jgi:hypothetical protein
MKRDYGKGYHSKSNFGRIDFQESKYAVGFYSGLASMYWRYKEV